MTTRTKASKNGFSDARWLDQEQRGPRYENDRQDITDGLHPEPRAGYASGWGRRQPSHPVQRRLGHILVDPEYADSFARARAYVASLPRPELWRRALRSAGWFLIRLARKDEGIGR